MSKNPPSPTAAGIAPIDERTRRFSLRFVDAALDRSYEDWRAPKVVRAHFVVLAVAALGSLLFIPIDVVKALPGELGAVLLDRFFVFLSLAVPAVLVRQPAFRLRQDLVVYLGGVGSLLATQAIDTHFDVAAVREYFAMRQMLFLGVIALYDVSMFTRAASVATVVAAGVLESERYAGVALSTQRVLVLVLGLLVLATAWRSERERRRGFVHSERARLERERADALLLSILPEPIANRLKALENPIADYVSQATVLFADLVGFTGMSARLPPDKVVERLDALFTRFDHLAAEHGLEKIKTIGDAYMAAGGLLREQPDHAVAATRLGLALVEVTDKLGVEFGEPLQVRVGIHTGPVVAGVIGHSKFAYDLWGDTVNTASRMESHGLPGRVHVSDETRAVLGDRFEFERRGEIDVKGKGRVATSFVTRERAAEAPQLPRSASGA